MNYFRINTLAKILKQNYEGFMLGMTFIVKSFLNKNGSDKTDTCVLFVIFYYWKWEKKNFFILIDERRCVAKQSWISVCCKKHFCEMLLSIFNIQGTLKSFVPWSSKKVSLCFSFSFLYLHVCGWSVRYKTLMVFK